MAEAPPSFAARLVLAFACFFKVLLDGAFASRVDGLSRALPEPPRPPSPEPRPEPPAPEPSPPSARAPEPPAEPRETAALQLLSMLQREGRLVDFLQEDVAGFSDADVGAAARLVHEGCRKALKAHVELEPVRAESEGARVTVPAGYDARQLKLTGSVRGEGPYAGTLKHRGWRARKITLPTLLEGADTAVITPAEVEL